MKYSLTLATILAIAGATYSQAEDVLPRQYNFDRYAKMVDQSPFAVATAVAAPAATPDFAKDLYIANAARSQDGDLVTISKDGNFATLTFNQALLSQVSPGGGVGARPLPAPGMPVPNPGGVPNVHAPKLPANVPPELQKLIPSRDAMLPKTRDMIQRSPRTQRGSNGGADGASKQ